MARGARHLIDDDYAETDVLLKGPLVRRAPVLGAGLLLGLYPYLSLDLLGKPLGHDTQTIQ